MATTWLRTGDRLALRALSPTDGERLRRLGGRLSADSLYRRFLSPAPSCDFLLPRLLDVDHWDREAIVALEDDEIIAVARYARTPGAPAAEVSVVVADAWQHRGLGPLLLRRLARLARRRGIAAFTGTTAGENRPAQLMLRALSPAVRASAAGGAVEFEVPLARS
jgi:GNAT superfamily N-acetyltransferase